MPKKFGAIIYYECQHEDFSKLRRCLIFSLNVTPNTQCSWTFAVIRLIHTFESDKDTSIAVSYILSGTLSESPSNRSPSISSLPVIMLLRRWRSFFISLRSINFGRLLPVSLWSFMDINSTSRTPKLRGNICRYIRQLYNPLSYSASSIWRALQKFQLKRLQTFDRDCTSLRSF